MQNMKEAINKINDLISQSIEAAEKLTEGAQKLMGDKTKSSIVRNTSSSIILASAEIYATYAKELIELRQLIEKSK